jgi:uncharacterized repeat protein (TIGR03847 family)
VREIYELSEPDRVSFGTVGEVGERVFLLQARQGQQVVTLKLEKTQVSTLCHVLGRLLRGLDGPGELPPGGTDLEPFVLPDLVVRALQLGYDGVRDRVVLLCADTDTGEEPYDVAEESEDSEGSVVRLAMSREQAMALAIRGTELVESGRPSCPRCGYPLDPRGHVCPKLNGNAPPRI